MINYILFGGLAYILGSIPTAVWVGKAWYDTDIREHGSKNAGATNTFRVLGKKAGILVLTVDILKGVLAVLLPLLLLSATLSENQLIHIQLVCAICAVLGHVFPVFARFKGGKGVATSLGVIIGIHPLGASMCLALFLIVFISSRFVSLGAICAAIAFPCLLAFYFKVESNWLIAFAIVLATAVIAAHHKNIKRLIKGEENRMNLFKK